MEKVLIFAESELSRYYKAITGKQTSKIRLETDTALAGEKDDIYLDDKFCIEVSCGSGIIKGINGRSVLEGVYYFLKQLGCRFLRPSADGEIISHREEEECTVNITVRPYYRFRTVAIEGAASLSNIINLIDWSMKNGFNSYFTQFRDSHTFFERWYNHERNEYKCGTHITSAEAASFISYIISELKSRGMLYHAVGHGWTCECLGYPSKGWNTVKDSDIPPEKRKYLAQKDGVRKFYLDIPLYSQLCYSNSEVQKLITDEVVNYAEQHTEIDYLHFWLGDNYNNFCECGACAKKTPSDWYIIILNEIDRRLTEKGLRIKIVFLIYFELLWPPIKERFNNPDRFVMMFAPITRTYAHSFLKGGQPPKKETCVMPQFNLNKVTFPSDIETNLSFLYEYQKQFIGDSFDFDYHLMWEPYKDLGGLQIAKTIYEDIRGLEKIGLKGLVSCQVQKVFMPHGLGMYVMGRALENPFEDFEKIKKEYFEAAFGQFAAKAIEISGLFDKYGCSKYLRNEIPRVDGVTAEGFIELSRQLGSAAEQLNVLCSRTECKTVNESLRYLAFYCRLTEKYLQALAAKACGESDETVMVHLKEMRKFLFTHESEAESVLDTYYFDYMATEILSSRWNVLADGKV